MPHLTVRGIPEKELKGLAPILKKNIIDASGAKAEYVKIFYSPVKRIDEPEEIAMDIYWMPRSQDICDRVAKALTDTMKANGKGFVQVTFTEFPGNLFYEDNVHY